MEPAPYSAAEAPRALWALLRGSGHDDALEALVRHYQQLVSATAYRFKTSLPSYISAEDLLSYGQFGLLRAIDRYDPAQGTPFRRFASSYIYGAILDELRSQDWAPRGLRREQRLVRQATARVADTEDDPSISSIAAQLGWDAARLESTLREVNNSHHLSLDHGVDAEEPAEEVLRIETTNDMDGHLTAEQLCLVFVETFESFDEVTQYVMTRVYFMGETLTAVSSSTALPLAVIRKIHMEAVNCLFERVQAAVS